MCKCDCYRNCLATWPLSTENRKKLKYVHVRQLIEMFSIEFRCQQDAINTSKDWVPHFRHVNTETVFVPQSAARINHRKFLYGKRGTQNWMVRVRYRRLTSFTRILWNWHNKSQSIHIAQQFRTEFPFVLFAQATYMCKWPLQLTLPKDMSGVYCISVKSQTSSAWTQKKRLHCCHEMVIPRSLSRYVYRNRSTVLHVYSSQLTNIPASISRKYFA